MVEAMAGVTPIHPEEPTQMSLEGFPLVGVRFSLVQAKELPSNQELTFEQEVSFHGVGRVKGRHERRDGKAFGEGARYNRTWEIEVIEAELD